MFRQVRIVQERVIGYDRQTVKVNDGVQLNADSFTPRQLRIMEAVVTRRRETYSPTMIDVTHEQNGAHAWAINFVRWYNFDHRHSGIRYVSPAQRHAGEDHAILAARHALYTQARDLNPARWSGATRNWSPVGAVTLNPERDSVVKTHSEHIDKQQLAA